MISLTAAVLLAGFAGLRLFASSGGYDFAHGGGSLSLFRRLTLVFFFLKDTFGSMTSAVFGIGLAISGFVFVGSIALLCLPKLGKATKWLAVVNIIASLAFVGLIVVTYLTEVPGRF